MSYGIIVRFIMLYAYLNLWIAVITAIAVVNSHSCNPPIASILTLLALYF